MLPEMNLRYEEEEEAQEESAAPFEYLMAETGSEIAAVRPHQIETRLNLEAQVNAPQIHF